MSGSGPAKAPFEASADVVIVGSGAGGGAAARELARAGHDVLVLEMGEVVRPTDMTQREEEMMPRLYQDAGSRTTADKTMTVIQGRGLGGSTLHNINLCKRIPDELLDQWDEEHGLEGLSSRLAPHYAAMEELLAVGPVPEAMVNRNNQILRTGAERLGWQSGPLMHNRVGCIGSGFCELGCAYDAKMNSARVLLPDAAAHGARLVTRARVTRIMHRFGRARGVSGVVLGEGDKVLGPLRVHAKQVVLAASATGSSALVRASGLRDPYRRAGRGLTLHPGATVGGVFEEKVEAWRGIPQSWEVTEFLHPTDPSRRVWIVPVFGHPVGVGAMLPGIGPEYIAGITDFSHIAAVTPMLHDHTRGEVDVDRYGRPIIRYRLIPEDWDMMRTGMAASARLLLAAGARSIVLPTAIPQTVHSEADLAAFEARTLRPLDPPLAAVHPMGGLAMGSDPRRAATTPHGRHHHCPNLWVADGSLFPSSTGVPPQLSIYTLGRMVGQAVAATLG